MLMEAKRRRAKDLEKEHAELVGSAMKLPGVADLMAVYKRAETHYLTGQKYLGTLRPAVFLSSTDSSS